MQKQSYHTNKPPNWLIKLCKYLWGKPLAVIWGVIISTFIGSLFFYIVITPLSTINFKPTVLGWLINNPGYFLFALALILSIYLGSHCDLSVLNSTISKDEIKARYLKWIIQDTEMLKFKDLPTKLAYPNIPLSKVFISLEFLPNNFTEYDEKKMLPIPQFDRELRQYLEKNDKIQIPELWQGLTKQNPVAVIQGNPGMGKSTLLARLALHMARLKLEGDDPGFPVPTDPLIPIFLPLDNYDAERLKDPGLPLLDYLDQTLVSLDIPDLSSFLRDCLKNGQCLVLLDGLDAVNDMQNRASIQDFIAKDRNVVRDDGNFNRFLFTSRITYNKKNIFSSYRHYLLAELSSEQIQTFWEQWKSAINSEQSAEIEDLYRTKSLFDDLQSDYQNARTIATNPLLLTLLAVMPQKKISLNQKIKLYSRIAHTLLENRNHIENHNRVESLPIIREKHFVKVFLRILSSHLVRILRWFSQQLEKVPVLKNIVVISETQAIRRLGFLADEMRKEQYDIALESEVLTSLEQANAGNRKKAKHFLNRLCEQGNLFICHGPGIYSFIHPALQEYIASHRLLADITKVDPNHGATRLIDLARNNDGYLGEAFVLAVTQKCSKNPKVAGTIIYTLLEASHSSKTPEHDLLVATECVLEAKPAIIGFDLEKTIAKRLLVVYEENFRKKQIDLCEKIESIILLWLLKLPEEHSSQLSPLLIVLCESISDTQQVVCQHATLTLLIMIAKRLETCSSIIFDTLVPPLLALAGQPKVGKYEPHIDLPTVLDLTSADLALTVLSFMGAKGPASLLLEEVRLHFEKNPNYLEALAQYSLKSKVLLTPIVVPQIENKFKRYNDAIWEWLILCNSIKAVPTTEQIEKCRKIHLILLNYAEEARYPTAKHLLNLLQIPEDSNWQRKWQDYFATQLRSGNSVSFQEIILLWIILFPEEQSLQSLANMLLQHYNSIDEMAAQRNARHFLAIFGKNLRTQLDLRYVRDILDMRDLRYSQELLLELNFHIIRNAPIKETISVLEVLRNNRGVQFLQALRTPQNYALSNQVFLNLVDLQRLRTLLLVPKTAESTRKYISSISSSLSTNEADYLDALFVLLGCVIQMRKGDPSETHDSVEQELDLIVQTVNGCFLSTSNDEVRTVILDIIRNLPVRTVKEFEIVLQLAEEAVSEPLIQQACADAFNQALPRTDNAWKALESGKRTEVIVVRTAIEDRLKGILRLYV